MSDVVLAAVKGFLYTSFAANLWWKLKFVITFVFRTGWIINALIFLPVSFIQNILLATWKDLLTCQRGVPEDTVITVCHTAFWYSLLKMMAEIKHNPAGKGQMANNSIWPLSKNAHSQLPLISSSYIFPGGPKKHWHVLCSTDWSDALLTNAVCSFTVSPGPDSYSSLTKLVILTTCCISYFYQTLCIVALLTWFVEAAHKCYERTGLIVLCKNYNSIFLFGSNLYIQQTGLVLKTKI